MVSPYSDGSAYDALVDNHVCPSIFDDADDLHLSAGSARREHFQHVAADRAATPEPGPLSATPSSGGRGSGSSTF